MPNELIAVLRADHDRILELVEEISVAKGQLPFLRQAAHDLEHELASHLGAEERVLVPAILDQVRLRGLSERALSEHVEIRGLLEELAHDPVGSPPWWAGFRRLRDAIHRNVDHEERHLFVEAASALPDEHWKALVAPYRRARDASRDRGDDRPMVTRDA